MLCRGHPGVHHNSISQGVSTVPDISGSACHVIKERKGNGDSDISGD